MPKTFKIKADDGTIHDMPWEGANDPTDDDVDIWLKYKDKPKEPSLVDKVIPAVKEGYKALSGDNTSEVWKNHPKIHDVLYGHQNDQGETVDPHTGRQLMGGNLPTASLGPVSGTGTIGAIANAPRVQQAAAGVSTAISGSNAYKHFQSGEYGKLPQDIGETALGALGMRYAGSNRPEPVMPPPPREPLALPPAPRTPSFIASEKSVISNNPIPAPHGAMVDPDVALRNFDTNEVPSRSSGFSTTDIAEQKRQRGIRGFSPESWSGVAEGRGKGVDYNPENMPAPNATGDRRLGFSAQSNADLPYPENIVPNAVRPRTAQSNTNRLTPNRFKFGSAIPESSVSQGSLPEIPEVSTESGFQAPELPSAVQIARATKIGNLPSPEEMPKAEGFENSPVLSDKPDLTGKTIMTGERVQSLLGMEPKEAIAKGLVIKDDSQGTSGYRFNSGEGLEDPRESAGARNRIPLEDSPLTGSELAWEHLRVTNPTTYEFAKSTGQEPLIPAGMSEETARAQIAAKARGVNENKSPLRDKLDKLKNDETGSLNISSKVKANTSSSGGVGSGKGTLPESNPLGTTSNIGEYRPIPKETPVRDAIEQWANGRSGANVRADFAKDTYSDIADNKTLIDKYETGDRTGRLADVQKELDQLHELGVKSGVFGPDQKKNNYLRHEFDNTAEEITAAFNNHVAKNPSIAKTRTFDTYLQAESTGLKRKYDNVPDVLHTYTQKLYNAVRTKELYDYLKARGILEKGTFDTKPTEWSFKGPDAPEAASLISKYFTPVGDIRGAVADGVSTTKNLYLGGGIPFTKYNMHQWNIARADAKLAGFGKATAELLTDPTGKTSASVFKEHKNLLPELVEAGYVFHPIEDTPKHTGIVGKILNPLERVFEDPLFKRSLPALKLKRTVDVYQKLLPSMGKYPALKEAASIGNEFYGGINKTLRDKNYVADSRIFLLAPDWLESRIRLAKRDYTGLAKTIIGKGTESDKIGAKSWARGMVTAGATLAGSYLAKGKLPALKDKPGDLLTVGTGKDDKHKEREIDTFGTSDEGIRVPIQVALRSFQGDPTSLIDMLVTSRMSLPAKVTINVLRGQDDFGNALKGKDKYGHKISGGKAIVNYLSELSRPAQLQVIQGMVKYANGDASLEEALSTAAELPVKYSKAPKAKHTGLGMGGIRMRSLGQ